MAEGPRQLPMRTLTIGVAVALLGGGIALLRTAPEPPRRDSAQDAAAAVEIAVHPVESREIQPHTRITGVLAARRSVELFAETSGRVAEKGAEDLDRVEADQVLVRVDPLLARIAVERAGAAVARGQSELSLARANLERRRSLALQNATSAAVLDAAENDARVAEAALRDARAALAEARDSLGKKTIRAPFAGVLREFLLEAGEYLQGGQRIGELLDLSAVRVTVGVSDRGIAAVRPGARAELELEAYPGESFSGPVLRVGSAADRLTKKFPVEIEIPNPDGRLLPGMITRVDLTLGLPRTLTLIPRDAVLDEYGLRFVYVVSSDGDPRAASVRRRRIQVRELPYRPEELEVLAGLEPGEVIARTGLRSLHDGAAVRPSASP